MRLTVLNVAYPFAPVGPDAVGGAEQIVAALDGALMRDSHRSLVVACEGSRCAGTLFPVPPAAGPLDDSVRDQIRVRQRQVVARALATWPVDLVHLHGVDVASYLPPPGVPALITLHLPPSWYPADLFQPERPDTYLHCVSASQRQRCPPGSPLLPDIPNGVPLDVYGPRGHKRPFALALGRICPEKGLHVALDAAHQAGETLLIGGHVFPYPAHQRYFETELAPRLDARRRFLGPLGLARKRRLLAAARCVLVPSLVEETSSLVAIEALASGTPVVAFRRGALAEIVEDGVTGFLVETVGDMAAALREVEKLNPASCRRAAEQRFCARRMQARYLQVYRSLTQRPPVTPRRAAPARIDVAAVSQVSAELCDDWAALWDRCPEATPFQHPAWVSAWLRVYSPGSACLLTFRAGDSGRLVGVAPLHTFRGPDGRGVLTVAGGNVSDYLDVLFDPAFDGAAIAALTRELQKPGGEWEARAAGTIRSVDAFEVGQLRPGSSLLQAVQAAGGHVSREAGGCPVLPLPGRAVPLAEVLPKGKLDAYAYARRRLARSPGFDLETAASPARVDELLESLFRLHAARWEARGQAGVLADAQVQRFHALAARGLLDAGLLRLHAVHAEGRIASVVYGFSGHGRCCYYLGGFDPSLRKLSVGTVAVGAAMEAAVAEGARAFDFLRGQEPYKYEWGAQHQQTFRCGLGLANGRQVESAEEPRGVGRHTPDESQGFEAAASVDSGLAAQRGR